MAPGINGEAKRSQRNRIRDGVGDLEEERERGKGWMFTVHKFKQESGRTAGEIKPAFLNPAIWMKGLGLANCKHAWNSSGEEGASPLTGQMAGVFLLPCLRLCKLLESVTPVKLPGCRIEVSS